MNEMQTRAIAAMKAAGDKWCDDTHGDWCDIDLEVLFKAAVEAIREPTDAMIVEAMLQPHPSVAEAGGVLEQGKAAVKIDYQAMIDEMLK